MSSILNTLRSNLSFLLESNKPKTFKSRNQNLSLAYENAIQQFKSIIKIEAHVEYHLVEKYLNGLIDQNHPSLDLLGGMIHVAINGNPTNTIFLSGQFKYLLEIYEKKITSGEDLQISWKSLFRAYLAAATNDDLVFFDSQLNLLRDFLKKTWLPVKAISPQILFELKDIDKYLEILHPEPWELYSRIWLDGLSQRVMKMAEELEIPDSSWFWDKLFVSILQTIIHFEDESFKKFIPQVLTLLDYCPHYRDFGVQRLLERFADSKSIRMYGPLMDYFMNSWGSAVGSKPKNHQWNDVHPKALKMAKSWHHERNLQIFFALKTGDKTVCQQRLNFWLHYLDRIEISRLALGSVGQKIVQSQSSLQKIFHPQNNPFSKLLGDINPEQNAIILKLNQVIIVDFILNDGCYIYEQNTNTFDINQDNHYATSYKGGLKERYGKYGITIPEDQDWLDTSYLRGVLSKYGI